MNKPSLFGQSAIEYLMTYGWMLLVVAVVGGAIFSTIGDQSIENVTGFNANEIQVNEFGMTASGLQMNIETFGANSITLKEIRLTDADQNITVPLNQDINAGDNAVLDLPHLKEGGDNTIDVEVIYDSNNLEGITTSGSITGNIEFDEDLIGYWTLGEGQANGTHVFDISSYENHGRINQPEWGSSYSKYRVLKFPESNRVDDIGNLPIIESYNENRELTINLWMNIDQVNTESSWNNVVNIGTTIDEEGNTDAPFRLERAGSSNDSLNFYTKHSGTSNENYRLGLAEPYNQNEWHMITFVMDYSDNGESRVYLDGIQTDVRTDPEDTWDMIESNMSIYSDGDWIDFRLGDLSYYDRPLSENQIEALYNNPGLVQ